MIMDEKEMTMKKRNVLWVGVLVVVVLTVSVSVYAYAETDTFEADTFKVVMVPTLAADSLPTVASHTEITTQQPVTVTVEAIGAGNYDVLYGWGKDVRAEKGVSGGWQFSYTAVPTGTVIVRVRTVSDDMPACNIYVDGILTAHEQNGDGLSTFCRVTVIEKK